MSDLPDDLLGRALQAYDTENHLQVTNSSKINIRAQRDMVIAASPGNKWIFPNRINGIRCEELRATARLWLGFRKWLEGQR